MKRLQKLKKRIKKPKKLKEALKEKLTKKEQQVMFRAYDVVGNIAIIDVPKELVKKEKLIAEKIIEMNKNIETVVKKVGVRAGIYRRQKLKIVAGKRTKVATYKENNIVLRFDVEKIYFSPRLATERKRITELVKPGENILVMFSGCGVYPIVMSRNSRANLIYCVEKNPVAHKFAIENVRMNKVNNVFLILGDVKKVVPNLYIKFDRILMPLPKGASKYLDLAFCVSKRGTIIHFYDFLTENDFADAKKKLIEVCKKNNADCRIIRLVKCGRYGPGIYRVCIDFKVTNIL